VDEGEGDHQQDSVDALAQVVLDGVGVAADRIEQRLPQARDRQHPREDQEDPAHGNADADPGASAGRPLIHDR
jgi:hypothetical protein